MYDIVEYKWIEESALKIQDERRTEMGILIRGGRIVDAATDTDKTGDIYLEDGVITEIGEKLKIKDKSDRVIDAKGCLVMPGLIDLHVHFRDPGQTQKEDIESLASIYKELLSDEQNGRDRFPGCCKRWCDNGCCNAEYNTGN